MRIGELLRVKMRDLDIREGSVNNKSSKCESASHGFFPELSILSEKTEASVIRSYQFSIDETDLDINNSRNGNGSGTQCQTQLRYIRSVGDFGQDSPRGKEQTGDFYINL